MFQQEDDRYWGEKSSARWASFRHPALKLTFVMRAASVKVGSFPAFAAPVARGRIRKHRRSLRHARTGKPRTKQEFAAAAPMSAFETSLYNRRFRSDNRIHRQPFNAPHFECFRAISWSLSAKIPTIVIFLSGVQADMLEIELFFLRYIAIAS